MGRGSRRCRCRSACFLLQLRRALLVLVVSLGVSYGPPWAHYLGGYQDRLLSGPLGLLDLGCTAPVGVKHKDLGGEVLG
jgi:hypothetical protein